eukprot:764811-Hanusia_phi.AAC.6
MPRKSKTYPPEVGTTASYAGLMMQLQVLDFAVYLGIDVEKEEDLVWIAGCQSMTSICEICDVMEERCLSEELPEPWTEHTSSRGDIYFYNR